MPTPFSRSLFKRWRWRGACLGLLAASAFGQAGDRADRPGDRQEPPKMAVPSALPLSPQESLKTFRLAPGFRLELVAAEPLVEAPVAIAFDPQGRLWVCEMRDYMTDADGGKSTPAADAPKGRIVVLDDTDGDGRMDRSTVFLDNLTLPRAVALGTGGVMVAEPPNLWLCPPSGAAGKTSLESNYANARGQPEYLPNGLLRSLDNWIYSAQGTARYRFASGGKFLREPTVSRGQWGIAQDDWGRLFYNYNGDHLRGDVVPAEYFRRNPNLRDPAGVNTRISRDQSVFPARVTPGVNRGYQAGILRADGTLRQSTAACGPTIYRGDLFPPEFRGNAFLCEPAGNLVRRDVLTELPGGGWTVQNPYGNAEFLASTEERFRPVNLCTGPEGALYVVDLHRGILQDKAYMTTYLRRQVIDRGLDRPLGQGRIYRIVPDSAKAVGVPKLADASPAALVGLLGNPNGYWRDTAQRLLVESGAAGAVPALTALAAAGDNPLARLHALWTLQGADKLEVGLVLKAMSDPHPRLRAAALRLSEPFLAANPVLADRALELARTDNAPEVRLQLALTLGELPGPKAQTALAAVLLASTDSEFVRDAALSSLRGRELEFLAALLADPAWSKNSPGRARLLGGLARCIYREHNAGRVARLLDLIPAQTAAAAWRGAALTDGLAALTAAPGRGGASKKADAGPVALAAAPAAPETLARVAALFTWPGKAAEETALDAAPLTPVQQARADHGKTVFSQTCAACHQRDGQGLEGLAPPLADSPWLAGSESRLVRIALHGVEGDINVNGKTYQMEMPPMGSLNDEDLAAALTYLRRRWGGRAAAPVEPSAVAAIRAQTAARAGAWTVPELLTIP